MTKVRRRTLFELLEWAHMNMNGEPGPETLTWRSEVRERLKKAAIPMAQKKYQNAPVSERKLKCHGCRDEHYNNGSEKCWMLNDASLVMRKKVHINDEPPWNHTPQEMPSCYRVPKYIMIDADKEY